MSEYLKRVSNIEKDPDQRVAFNSDGSQVVIAGPGSGKTYLLTTKAEKVLLEGQVRYPQKIACITFSRQMAGKLVQEFRKLGVYDSERMYVGTIHAFCIAEILMPAVGLLPAGTLPESFRIASESERITALSQALQEQKKSLPRSDWKKNIINDLDKFRRRYFRPETEDFSCNTLAEINRNSQKYLQNVNWAKLAGDYQEHLRQTAHGMDFAQVEMLALRVIRTKPALATTLAARYPWWFVDEYQDLSPLFHQMVMSLVQSGQINVFAIGDPNQCIYEGMQGSKPDSIKELSDAVKQLYQNTPITLRKNYRSLQNLIDFSSLMLDYQTPYQSNQEIIGQIHCIQTQGDLSGLVSRILGKMSNGDNKRPNDIAVLVSKRDRIKELLPKLESLGLDISPDKDPEFSSNTELLEWLEKAAQWCAGADVYFYDLLPFWYGFYQLQGESDSAKRFEVERELFRELWALRNGEMRLQDWLMQIHKTALTTTKLEGYRKLRPDDVEEFEKLVDAVATSSRLQQQAINSFGKQESQIFLTTFHSSKGLEFDTTIVIDLDAIRDDPSAPGLDNRVAYVAVSRAKSRMYVLDLQKKPGKFTQKLQDASVEELTFWNCDREGKITRRNEQK